MDDPSPATIDADVPCAGCGYNLRTLPGDGTCPECGRRVAESAWRFEVGRGELGALRLNDVDWRRAMCRGLSIAIIAWGMAFGGAIYALADAMSPPYREFAWSSITWLLPHVVVFTISYWAAWVLAMPRLGVLRTRVMRTALLIGVVAPALLFLNERFVAYYFHGPRHASSDSQGPLLRASQAIGRLATVAWPLVTALTFARVAHLAWLGRRRAVAVFVGLAGLMATGLNTLFAVGLNSFRYTLASGDLMPAMVGPTGTNTLVWTYFLYVARRFNLYPAGDLRNIAFWDVLGLTLAVSTILLAFALGPFYWAIRSTITRSIRLSESLDASCPTSPAPRLPAGSR